MFTVRALNIEIIVLIFYLDNPSRHIQNKLFSSDVAVGPYLFVVVERGYRKSKFLYGALCKTANTWRPALLLIRVTARKSRLSS